MHIPESCHLLVKVDFHIHFQKCFVNFFLIFHFIFAENFGWCITIFQVSNKLNRFVDFIRVKHWYSKYFFVDIIIFFYRWFHFYLYWRFFVFFTSDYDLLPFNEWRVQEIVELVPVIWWVELPVVVKVLVLSLLWMINGPSELHTFKNIRFNVDLKLSSECWQCLKFDFSYWVIRLFLINIYCFTFFIESWMLKEPFKLINIWSYSHIV